MIKITANGVTRERLNVWMDAIGESYDEHLERLRKMRPPEFLTAPQLSRAERRRDAREARRAA